MILDIVRKIILENRTTVIRKKFNYNNKLKYSNNLNFSISSYGEKNKSKIFYVIKRTPGGGMFSNINFIINHLLIAEKLNFVPIIDMQNFSTFYNENKQINKSYNAWDYYFKKINNYKIKEVYKSKKVIFTDSKPGKSKFFDGFENLNNDHKKISKKYIKFQKYIVNEANDFINKNFFNHKVLGVHFRGSDQKTQERHPFPATTKQIERQISFLTKKYKYTKIFLVTEEKKYLSFFKKKYKDKLIFFDSYVCNNQNIFDNSKRNLHRYKIGKENIINMICLSRTNHLLGVSSNMISAAKFFSKKNIKCTLINNGFNSDNIFIAQILWYVKRILPNFLGGFK